jgi:hypothetical protein
MIGLATSGQGRRQSAVSLPANGFLDRLRIRKSKLAIHLQSDNPPRVIRARVIVCFVCAFQCSRWVLLTTTSYRDGTCVRACRPCTDRLG